MVKRRGIWSLSASRMGDFSVVGYNTDFIRPFLVELGTWVGGTTISMAILFEPVGASVLAYYLLHEHIKVAQLIGSAMILFGLGLFILISNRKRKIQVRKVSD